MKHFFLLSLFLLFSNAILSQCTHPDYEGLMSLYNATNGTNWQTTTGWKEGQAGTSCDPCDFEGNAWYGLTCENDRVISIDFNPNNLFTTNLLGGQMVDLQLSELRTLDLSWNTMTGPIPEFLGMPKLDTLDLSANRFDGSVPNFAGIQQLKYLSLYQNILDEEIPDFTFLPQLKTLLLQECSLRVIPDFTNLSELEALDLSFNRFSNTTLPDFSSMSRLKSLKIKGAELNGPIPNFSNFPELQVLDLSSNALSACPDFNQMPSLEVLILKRNDIEGPVHPFTSLTKLQELDLRDNKMNGDIPSYNDKPDLVEIEINGIDITGQLPGFQNSDSLKLISIEETSISGPIPSYNWLPNLERIFLGENELTGNIPNFTGPNIERIDIDNNKLTGNIPELAELTNLSSFNISYNDIEGCYPLFICQIFFNGGGNYKLPWYGFFWSNICNDVPETDAPCSTNGSQDSFEIINEDCECGDFECVNVGPDIEMLLKLYESTGGENWTNQNGWEALAQNKLCDPCRPDQSLYGVTCENGRVSCIDFNGGANVCDPLGVGGNNLVGTLPRLEFDSLKALRLNYNNLSGALPDISGMPELEILSLAFNNFSGAIPSSIVNSTLKTIRLSTNDLTGPIPPIENPSKLEVFTAAFNNLSGCYPDSICTISLIDFADNPQLPFDGNVDLFCMGEDQIGAPCNSELFPNYIINEDCTCTEFISATDVFDDDKFYIYPNPIVDELNFSQVVKNSQIQLFNNLGALVMNVNVKECSTLDISQLETGIYFVKITDFKNLNSSHTIFKN